MSTIAGLNTSSPLIAAATATRTRAGAISTAAAEVACKCDGPARSTPEKIRLDHSEPVESIPLGSEPPTALSPFEPSTVIERVQSGIQGIIDVVRRLHEGTATIGDLFAAIQRAATAAQDPNAGNTPLVDPRTPSPIPAPIDTDAAAVTELAAIAAPTPSSSPARGPALAPNAPPASDPPVRAPSSQRAPAFTLLGEPLPFATAAAIKARLVAGSFLDSTA